jgi:acyl-CoA reductase-like NAD-dependent aldehyde dehydrogenase
MDFEAPFGGTKTSGYGRECSAAAVDEYVYLHATTSRRL